MAENYNNMFYWSYKYHAVFTIMNCMKKRLIT